MNLIVISKEDAVTITSYLSLTPTEEAAERQFQKQLAIFNGCYYILWKDESVH
ncbi:hypothetical protein ACFDTO_22880 [Microbacteriaceae bacterium 4G12]